MAHLSTGRRSRHGATAAACLLAITALVLGLLGVLAQVHAAPPSPSTAHPAAEGNLPAPPTPAASAGPSEHRPAVPSGPNTTRGSTQQPVTPATVGPVLARSRPVALTIPAIDIHHTHLAEYGTDAKGAIDVPPATGGVPPGWYTGSPTPGQVGPSVIVGHTDGAKDGRSVFFRLGQLRPGDQVQVTRADHTVAVFRVDSLEDYPKAGFPTQRVYGNINHAGLRLISCIGQFDRATGHYLDNIVVYAHLVTSHHS